MSKSSSNAVVIEPRFRINAGRRLAFGPGKAELLAHIDRTGSIAEAARAMDMSYMRAWTLVKSLDRAFAEPLVLKVRGGPTQGASLTPTGRAVLELYQGLTAQTAAATEAARQRLAGLLKD